MKIAWWQVELAAVDSSTCRETKYLATSEDSDTTSFSASAMCQQRMSRTIRVHANIISDLQNLDSSAGWIACQDSFPDPDPDPWALIPVLGLQNSSPSLIQVSSWQRRCIHRWNTRPSDNCDETERRIYLNYTSFRAIRENIARVRAGMYFHESEGKYSSHECNILYCTETKFP